MKTSHSRCRHTSGSVLPTAIVITAIIGVALAAYLTVVSNQNQLVVRSQVWNTAMAVAGSDDAIEADALMSASVELTAYQLFGMPAQARPTRGVFDFRLGRANVAVEFCSEAARVDLNEAPKELLSGLFIALGAQPDAARQYADRVVGWRTTRKTGARDEEAALYRAAGYDTYAVALNRKYSEMKLANLRGAGDAVRELGLA